MEVSPDRAALEEFFADVPLGREVYDAVAAVVEGCGPATTRVTRSQVALRRRTGFCWVWLPGRYLRRPAAQVVVSVALDHPDPSPRWKQVVEVGRGRRWMHHLEVRSVDEVDDEVARWVAAAYELAG
ncbi:MAG TPA: DUF5655 domain-containing protein [Nocardioidaceae bacterium]